MVQAGPPISVHHPARKYCFIFLQYVTWFVLLLDKSSFFIVAPYGAYDRRGGELGGKSNGKAVYHLKTVHPLLAFP